MKHPHIISCMGYCATNQQIVLVMNFVDGSNLDMVLFSKKHKREVNIYSYFIIHAIEFFKFVLQIPEVHIAYKITDAVNYMHTHSPVIIHQDLKPQNVLVCTTS